MTEKMIFLIILIISETKAIINPYGPTIVSDFTNCLNDLMDYNFKESGLLIFANTNNVSSSAARIRSGLLQKIHENIRHSVQILSPTNEPAICNQNNDDQEEIKVIHMDQFEAIPIADYFIVIIDNYKDFSQVASRLIRSRSWNPQAKFIVLFFNFVEADKFNIYFVEQILTCLFKYNVINIVVLVPESSNIRNAKVYSWRPYDPPKYCGYSNETAKHRLLIETTCERGAAKQRKDIFKDRLPRDMKHCMLHILALERQPFVSKDLDGPNTERGYVNEIANFYNFDTHYEFVNSFRGQRNDEGEWDGALKDLLSKKEQVLLGGIFPDNDVHEDFECSSSYLADSYTWVVPRATESPPWISLIIIFNNLVWCSVIAVYIICAFTWKFLGQLSGDSQYQRALHHCFINTWVSQLGFVTDSRPVKESVRVFFVFFNLYCILFLTAYQTKLFDVLTNPSFGEQIDTVEELITSGLKFGGFEELHDIFHNSTDPFDYYIGEQWTGINNITDALIDVAVHRNFSVLCSRLELAHLSSTMLELSDSFGNEKFFSFRENMFSVPLEMVALRGFAFMREFSATLGIFKQLGVNAAVRRKFSSYNSRRKAKLQQSLYNSHSDATNPLSLQHLQGGFLALALGFVGGTLALFIEIVIESNYFKGKMSLCKKRMKRKSKEINKMSNEHDL